MTAILFRSAFYAASAIAGGAVTVSVSGSETAGAVVFAVLLFVFAALGELL